MFESGRAYRGHDVELGRAIVVAVTIAGANAENGIAATRRDLSLRRVGTVKECVP